MKNFLQSLKNKINELDSQALNSLRVIIILSLTLVFGVVLYRQTFNAPSLAKQAVATSLPRAGAYLSSSIAREPAVSFKDQSQVQQDVAVSEPAEAAVFESAQEGDAGQELGGVKQNVVVTPSAVKDKNDNSVRNISAKSAIIVDGDTGQVIFQDNADEKLPMASLTKLMTAVIVSENLDFKERVAISKNAAAKDGTAGGLKAGEELTAEDLMKVMLIVSSNDAAFAFQEHFAGKNLDLIALMNQKAEELGMKDTHFANPAGLDEDGHYSTARDLAQLASYVLRKEGVILGIISQKQSTVYSLNKNISHYLLSTNQLLHKNNPDVLGGKTGFTKNAQGCMISILKSGKIIVVLGSQDRFGDTEKLMQNVNIKM